jgi:signal transduction histidine kinase
MRRDRNPAPRAFTPQAGRHSSAPASRGFELAGTIEGALAACRAQIAGTIVTRRIAPQRLPGSGEQIKQVLAHLLVNAAWATRATGRVRVIHIDARRLAGRVRVRVSDNGVGIDPDVGVRMFEPFFSTRPAAMGLGLALCHAIVRAHGGELRAINRLPHGARFEFDLPAARTPHPYRHGQRHAVCLPGLASRTVHIVERIGS